MDYNFTIRKKDKNFQIIVSYKDINDTWHQKSKQGFTTQKQAKQAGYKIVEELKGKVISKSNISLTFEEYFNIVMEEKKNVVAYNTIRSYRDALKVFPLKSKPITAITRSDLVKWINTLSGAYKPSSIQTLSSMPSVIFKHAYSNGIIKTNPYYNIQLPHQDKKHISTFTSEECNKILNHLKVRNEERYFICLIAIYTGLRFGEVLALTWDDINFSTAEVRINKQYSLQAHGNNIITSRTKTQNSKRTIPFPDKIKGELLEYKKHSNNPQLFPMSIKPTRSVSRYINKAIKASIGHGSFHSFRHTYATNLLANGVDIKTVAALLGDTVTTVIKTYIHYTEEMRKAASQKVNKIFDEFLTNN